jgi:hypothetical protein
MIKLNSQDAVESFETQFASTTNQGVVGSIPASRTNFEKPATQVAGFLICVFIMQHNPCRKD